MEKFVITGGIPLQGTIKVGGAKNAVLPILAATLLTTETCLIKNVPRFKDVDYMEEVLRHLGASTAREDGIMAVRAIDLETEEVPDNLMQKMRASNLVMGPLLARRGQVRVAAPGGCNIGSRPMDLHLKGFKALGAEVDEIRYGFIQAKANKLRGARIVLDYPSVGATENLMLAAVLAEGETILQNAAREPEIIDLQHFLNKMGAKIKGAGTGTIAVEGVSSLGGTEHTVIPDRIEAGTHLLAGAVTRGDLLVTNVIPEHLQALINKLEEAGAIITEDASGLRVKGVRGYTATDLKTLPYPGFPTDLQPQATVLLCMARGTSFVTETVFENRYKHVDELRRMGARIKIAGRSAVIEGVPRLSGAIVEATDLRAGAALVLAGMAADGATVVENIEHIARGYVHLESKYNNLGARIIKVSSST